MNVLVSIENMRIALNVLEQLGTGDITTIQDLKNLILKEIEEDEKTKNTLKELNEKYLNKYVKLDLSFERTEYSVQKIANISLRPMRDGYIFFSNGAVISKNGNSYTVSINNNNSFNFSLNNNNLEKELTRLSILSEEEFIDEYTKALDSIKTDYTNSVNKNN